MILLLDKVSDKYLPFESVDNNKVERAYHGIVEWVNYVVRRKKDRK